MWDERYGESEWAYGTQANDWLVELAEQIPSGPVLCLAEGQGRNAVFLAQRGHAVTAVDQSAVGLARARELAASRKVSIETVQADLRDYPLPASHFAAIVSIWAHMPSEVRVPLHARCFEALRPGGLFILEAYTPEQLERDTGGPKNDDFLLTRARLERELPGLEVLRCETKLRMVSEGKYHQGESAVVQYLGRKPS